MHKYTASYARIFALFLIAVPLIEENEERIYKLELVRFREKIIAIYSNLKSQIKVADYQQK